MSTHGDRATPDSRLGVEQLLATAQAAVRMAVEHIQTHPHTQVRDKSDRDLVTDTDLTVEHLVRQLLAAATPTIAFLGEETGAYAGTDDTQDRRWVLDPIDGTTNFAHGLPLYAVALGLIQDHEPVLGVVGLPALDRCYWATRGGGAYRDTTRLRVASTATLATALVAISDYGTGRVGPDRDLVSAAIDHDLSRAARGVRRLGSAAVELCLVAEGSLDASITIGNQPWDTAAGAIIAREAGAILMDADGSSHTTRSCCAIACTPGLRTAVLEICSVARGSSYWPAPPATATALHPAHQPTPRTPVTSNHA